MSWYVLYVETGQEEIVKCLIKKYFADLTIEVIVPKRKIREKRQGELYEVSKLLFPGYVFLNTYMNIDIYYGLKKIPRCFRLLNSYKYKTDYLVDDVSHNITSVFCTIEQKEIAPILQLLQQNETIDFSQIYKEDSEITVISGPLKGLEGIIKKIDKRKNRAKIELNFMGVIKLVDVGVEVLTRDC
ncbi:antiterminator LoaP [Bacillus siamensis]|uniref:antiterminator LoaP n=1 Tax=Bacillus siamensis TaxID=659243 RepID=UPI0006488497|nr:antiterminator LoaP [Bacillus siamensis]MDU0814644.1 antiterminator LoaP [Bacillus siamensis]